MDHDNKTKNKLDFIFTKITKFTKELFFTILKHKFFTFTDLPACRTHAYARGSSSSFLGGFLVLHFSSLYRQGERESLRQTFVKPVVLPPLLTCYANFARFQPAQQAGEQYQKK